MSETRIVRVADVRTDAAGVVAEAEAAGPRVEHAGQQQGGGFHAGTLGHGDVVEAAGNDVGRGAVRGQACRESNDGVSGSSVTLIWSESYVILSGVIAMSFHLECSYVILIWSRYRPLLT